MLSISLLDTSTRPCQIKKKKLKTNQETRKNKSEAKNYILKTYTQEDNVSK